MEYRTKQELIYQDLYNRIVSGAYRPGERLDIAAVADRAGTSRTPVREALRRLESDGLVTSIPHRGTLVSELSLDEVAELYQIRAALEGLAARRAAGDLSDQQAEALREVCEEMDFCAEAESRNSDDYLDRFLDLNHTFHELVNRAANSPLLLEYIDTLYASTSRYRRLVASTEERVGELLQEHKALADAVIAGDKEEAERLARLHHQRNAEALERFGSALTESVGEQLGVVS